MEKILPHDQNQHKISNRLKNFFFRKVTKNKTGRSSPMNMLPSESSPKISEYQIPGDLQYAYEKYNALVEDIQKLQQQAILKLEKLGLGKYAKELLKAIYEKQN
jgi:hypothetical protein